MIYHRGNLEAEAGVRGGGGGLGGGVVVLVGLALGRYGLGLKGCYQWVRVGLGDGVRWGWSRSWVWVR